MIAAINGSDIIHGFIVGMLVMIFFILLEIAKKK